jgi:hypothetical protein
MPGLRASLRTMQVDQHPPGTTAWLDPIERSREYQPATRP